MNAPTLETDRLVLRAHVLDDLDASAAMWSDPDVVRFISGQPSTPELSFTRLLRHAGSWAVLGFGYWVVESRSDGQFLGEVGFADFKRDVEPPLGPYPEMGWVLRTAVKGNGYATEAVGAALVWADQALDVEKYVCICNPEHHASLTVARKSGFVQCGERDFSGEPVVVLERHCLIKPVL